MSPSSSPNRQSSSSDPFNHYNTEFVKLDANNWQEDSCLCNPPELSDFVCLKVTDNSSNEPASSHTLEASPTKPADSINVKIFAII